MKLKKKLALVMATVATITSISTTTALADTSDTFWSLSANQSSRVDGLRQKDDDTSAWGSVWNYYNNEPGEYVSMQLKRDMHGNDLVGTYRVLPPVTWHGSGSRYIPSNAYENGYRDVAIRIQSLPLTYTRYMNGYWSPDSY